MDVMKKFIILGLFVLAISVCFCIEEQRVTAVKSSYENELTKLTEQNKYLEDQLIAKNTKIAEQTTQLEDAVFKIEELQKTLEFIKSKNSAKKP